MTPEARLAAALEGLHDANCDLFTTPYFHGAGECSCDMLDMARAILAADPTLAADLALAAAVRDDLEVYGTACLTRRADGSVERIPPEMVRLDVHDAKEAERPAYTMEMAREDGYTKADKAAKGGRA